MRVKSAVRLICKHCYFETKGKKLYVRCKAMPRHKQRQGFSSLQVPPNADFKQLYQYAQIQSNISFNAIVKIDQQDHK